MLVWRGAERGSSGGVGIVRDLPMADVDRVLASESDQTLVESWLRHECLFLEATEDDVKEYICVSCDSCEYVAWRLALGTSLLPGAWLVAC